MQTLTRESVAAAYGDYLGKTLSDRGWSQTQLQTEIAIATGSTVTQPSISEYIRGERLPDFITMLRIGVALDEPAPLEHLIVAAKATGLYLDEDDSLLELAANRGTRSVVGV